MYPSFTATGFLIEYEESVNVVMFGNGVFGLHPKGNWSNFKREDAVAILMELWHGMQAWTCCYHEYLHDNAEDVMAVIGE
jgi:hypothetical protein